MAITFTTTQAGASADYVKYIYRDVDNTTPLKTDRYGDSTYFDFYLVPTDSSFVKLTRGSYINMSSTLYPNWFTGYIIADPEVIPIGKAGGVPVWGYKYRATADEYILSLKPLGVMKPFMNMTMGAILKQLIQMLVPNTFDVSNIQDGPIVAQYPIDPTKKFVDIQQDFTSSASFRFYGNNKKLYFLPQDNSAGSVAVDGSNRFAAIMNDGSSAGSSSSAGGGVNSSGAVQVGLEMRPSADPILNDVTAQGDLEPQVYCTEYFMGTGFEGTFFLSNSVYGVDTSVLIDEQFSGSSISSNWTVFDPAAYLQLSNGYLNSLGGDGSGNLTAYLQSNVSLPMSGKMRFTHGAWDFVGTGDSAGQGVICSCWTAAVNGALTGCLYGLKVINSSAFAGPVSIIQPIANGVLDTSQTFYIDNTKRYIIRTLVSFGRSIRSGQTYSYISKTGVRGSYTPAASADVGTWQTIITEIDPTTGLMTYQQTFTNTTTVTGSGDLYAAYVPLASDSLHATVSDITVSIPLNATLEFSTVVPLNNLSFEQWDDSHHPTGWTNYSTPTASQINQETDPPDGYCLGLLVTGGVPKVAQSATTLLPNTAYTIYGTAALAGLRSALGSTDELKITLIGTGVSETGLILNLQTLFPTQETWVPFSGVLTTPTTLSSIPSDLALNVYWSGTGTGYTVNVDSLVIQSAWTQQLVGPNEIDSMDGLSPVATVVQSNSGSDTYNSYTGAAQYNPGQPQLVFFKDSITYTSDVPPANQSFRLTYRSGGGAIGRAISSASINTESAYWGDNGIRSIVRNDLSPRPQNSAECELAAAALVQESSFAHYEGIYTQYSDYLTQEPKSGAIISFSNIAGLGSLYEEINEVDTTLDGIKGLPSTDRFIHKITYGKPDRINQLLKKYALVPGSFQASVQQPNVPPVDISAIGTSYYAPDILKPQLLGWSNNFYYFDLGTPLGSAGLFYELRYSDDSWGCNPGKNLIAGTTLQKMFLPRALRGGTFFSRIVNKGNYHLYSEDQSQSNYSNSNAPVTMALGQNPDGFQSNIGSVAFGSGGGTFTGSLSYSGSGTSACWSISVKGTKGTSVTMTMRGTGSTVTTTLTGYWQRISLPITIASSGGFTTEYFDLHCATNTTVQVSRYSVEFGTSSETMYTQTIGNPYGPLSRYTSMIKVSYPAPDTLSNIDLSTLVMQPTY